MESAEPLVERVDTSSVPSFDDVLLLDSQNLETGGGLPPLLSFLGPPLRVRSLCCFVCCLVAVVRRWDGRRMQF